MRMVFADTAFYVALANERDQLFDKAIEFLAEYDGNILTTQFVLIEFANFVRRVERRATYDEFVKRMAEDKATEILPVSAHLFDQGEALFIDHEDKEWSLTDCISFVVMKQYGLTDALTADHHFEQAGFRALLKN